MPYQNISEQAGEMVGSFFYNHLNFFNSSNNALTSFNNWHSSSRSSIPTPFTPFQSLSETFVAAADIIVKPLLSFVLLIIMPFWAISELLTSSKTVLDKLEDFLTESLAFVIYLINTPIIATAYAINFISRSLSTLIDSVSKLINCLSNNMREEEELAIAPMSRP